MAWVAIGQLAGGAGSGATWTTGHGAPGSSGVNTGDMYLNVDNGDVYRWNGVSWSLAGNITGPTGATGATGPPGSQGIQGNTGSTGLTGDIGRPNIGPVGPRGNDGTNWLIGTADPDQNAGVIGDYYFKTVNNPNGPIVLKGDPGSPGAPGQTGPPGVPGLSNVGFALLVPFPGINWITASNSADNGFAILCYVTVPSPMYLHSLGVDVNTGNSGTVQWGIFDYTRSATAATKIAGGTGTLGTGYGNINAAGGPILILPGSYVVIYLCAAANTPTINKSNLDFATIPFQKSQGAYVWTDTPDLTTGWSNDGTLYNLALHGQLTPFSGKY